MREPFRWPRWRDQSSETRDIGDVRLLGPFEFWLSPRCGWRARRLNTFGPPPHALALELGRLRIVWWYRDAEALDA